MCARKNSKWETQLAIFKQGLIELPLVVCYLFSQLFHGQYVASHLENTPMGNELKWLLKKGGGHIFKSCDISLKNTPISHAVSLTFVICTCSDSAMPLHNSMYCSING